MKKLTFLFVLILAACTTEKPTNSTVNKAASPEVKTQDFAIDISENTELDFEKMRIYPIVASDEHIAQHAALAGYKNLKEAMEIKSFRITEAKPFGDFQDVDAVNNLTVQNKSKDTIYLMAGDVVQGGNQDRVLAQDMVLPPRTLTNIEVFCVEKGRWNYREETSEETEILAEATEEEAKKNEKIYAFTGYYNVVSNDVRKTVKFEKDQSQVWAAVGDITTTNNASSSTGTYAALENSQDFTVERNKYLAFFDGKMDEYENVIGMVVVSGNEILGTDMFNHPVLFKKQYQVLLHAYVTDAISNGKEVNISEQKLKNYQVKINRDYKRRLTNGNESEVKFRYDGKIVHFSHL